VSIRLDIQNALIGILKGISRAAGYHTDIGQVTKRLKAVEAVKQFPAASVIVGPVSRRPASSDAVLKNVQATFAVIGYVKCETDTTDEGKLNDVAAEFIEDLEEAILADETLMQAFDAPTWTVEIESEPPYLDWQNNFAEVMLAVVATFYHDKKT
jgi:hypothetical protein